MTILGIDPGFGRVGYACIKSENQSERLILSGLIETSPKTLKEIRLFSVSDQLKKIIKKTKPDLVGIERLYFSKNTKTALGVAEGRGALLSMVGSFSIPVVEVSPNSVKLTTTGYGAASKQQVADMVVRILHLDKPLSPDDVSDAAAIAITAIRSK